VSIRIVIPLAWDKSDWGDIEYQSSPTMQMLYAMQPSDGENTDTHFASAAWPRQES